MQTSGSFSGDQIRRVSSALGANTGWLWLSVEDGCIDAGPGLETAMAGVPCVLPSLPLPHETFQGRSMNEAENILEVLAYMGIPPFKIFVLAITEA